MPIALKIIVSVVVLLIMLVSFFRSGHFFKSFFGSAIRGGVSLLGVNALGALTGVVLAVNKFTLGFVCLLGLPGTITLVICDMIFRLK